MRKKSYKKYGRNSNTMPYIKCKQDIVPSIKYKVRPQLIEKLHLYSNALLENWLLLL